MLIAIMLAYVVCRRYADPSNARRIERFRSAALDQIGT